MNPAVLDLILKGVQSLPVLFNAGADIWARVQEIETLAQKAKAGTLTHADIVATRAKFDATLDDFNKPMDPQ